MTQLEKDLIAAGYNKEMGIRISKDLTFNHNVVKAIIEGEKRFQEAQLRRQEPRYRGLKVAL
jgi:hypothetical protein